MCRIWILLLAVVAVAFWPSLVSAGFGVSPPKILEDRLVPGSHFERTIFLVQGSPEADVDIIVSIDSEDIKEWITFAEGDHFTIPAGVQQFPLHVTIAVPDDTELDIYRAYIRVSTDPEKVVSAGEVAISIGGRIDVELTVGDDVFEEFEVKRIQIPDIRERKPLRAILTILNTGNVPSGPASVSYELFNKFGEIRLAFSEITENLPPIPAFSEGNIDVEFPLDIVLAPGEYWAHVKVYDHERVLKGELRTVFIVHEGGLASVLSSGTTTFSIAGGVVIIFIILAVLLVRRRRVSRKK